MNAQTSFHSSGRDMGDEPDDPGPSSVADQADQPPEPQLRIGGEAVAEIDAAWLRRQLAQAVRHVPARVATVNIEIVHDETMAALHERHMGIASTTDVLTFCAPESSSGGRGGGEADIAVCLDEARWRADQYEHAVERELLLYALHGLLHCAGFDDHDEAGFTAMHAEEDRILEAIGVGRTFWRDQAETAGHDAGFAHRTQRDARI